MAIEFKLPEVSEGVESADIAELHVKEGDTITANQIVAEVETEKRWRKLNVPTRAASPKCTFPPVTVSPLALCC